GNATHPVIDVHNRVANTTSTINIGSGATVEAIGGPPTRPATPPGNTASTVGSVVVNDSGDLIGDLLFASLVGNGTAGNATIPANISNTTVNVTGGGVWLTSGTSTFGNGAFG